jgi:hypothetical protein
MSELQLEPLAATVTWRFEAPLPLTQWQALLAAFLQLLAGGAVAAGPRVIGHIKALAALPDGGYIRASVVDMTHGVDVQAGGKLPAELPALTFLVNVLVYGLPRDVASRQLEGAALAVACEHGGQTLVDIPHVKRDTYQVEHH